jgi:hypothetical protein
MMSCGAPGGQNFLSTSTDLPGANPPAPPPSASSSSSSTPAVISGLALVPSTVEGGNPVVGTLTLTKPATASGQVNLTTGSGASAQSSINLAQGQSSATFVVNTSPVTVNVTTTVTATYNNSKVAATLIITPPVSAPLPATPPAAAGTPIAFYGCIYRENGVAYQAVKFQASGTLAFDGKLYWGATCSSSQLTDEIGFGVLQSFGGFSWKYWFIHYGDKLNTSAIWTVGDQKSQCIDYSIAPDCN